MLACDTCLPPSPPRQGTPLLWAPPCACGPWWRLCAARWGRRLHASAARCRRGASWAACCRPHLLLAKGCCYCSNAGPGLADKAPLLPCIAEVPARKQQQQGKHQNVRAWWEDMSQTHTPPTAHTTAFQSKQESATMCFPNKHAACWVCTCRPVVDRRCGAKSTCLSSMLLRVVTVLGRDGLYEALEAVLLRHSA